jgi:autotransporter-associated beta strand protein
MLESNNYPIRILKLVVCFVCIFSVVSGVAFLAVLPKEQSLDSAKFIKANPFQQVGVAVAGSSEGTKYAVIIPKDQVTKDKYLLSLPKEAKDIGIKFVSQDEVDEILTGDNIKNSSDSLTNDSRLALLENSGTKKKSDINFLTRISVAALNVANLNFGLADKRVVDLSGVNFAKGSSFIEVNYELPSPTITQQTQKKKVTIKVSDPDEIAPVTGVLAHAVLPKIYKVGQEKEIHLAWLSNNKEEVPFESFDLDEDDYIDYIEWRVPHLSDQEFEIILISKAWELDQDKNIIGDVYNQLINKDGQWATIWAGNYIRSTFGHILDSEKDITIYAKSSLLKSKGNGVSIEVYPVYTDKNGNEYEGERLDLVNDGVHQDFSNINEENTYKVLLKNLAKPTHTFDLRVVSNVTDLPPDASSLSQSDNKPISLDIDWVVDPGTTLYWVGDNGANTNVASNWKTSDPSGCGGGNSASAPTNVDTLIFDADCDNGATFNASITASTGGIVVQSGYAGTITGANSITYANAITIQDNATISVGTGNTFTLSGIIGDGGANKGIFKTGLGTLTLSGANTFTGGLTIKAGTVIGLTNASAFGGSGTGTITIGDTSGAADATLTASSLNTDFANPIIVASGSSGTLTITALNYPNFTGAITLNNNLTVSYSASATNMITISGGITGTGNLIIQGDANSNHQIVIQTNPVNITGTITNSGTGSGYIQFSAVIGSNVTGVIQNSSTSQLTLSGDNSSYAGGVTIKAGTVRLSTTANAAGTGTITIGDSIGSADAILLYTKGDTFSNPITVASGSSGTLTILNAVDCYPTLSGAITLNNNLTLTNLGANNLTLTGGITGTGNITINNTGSGGTPISTTSVNNTGTITNSGTGTGTTTISAVIGSNVTGVIQNSATSELKLSGNNSSYAGGVTIKAGTVQLSTSANAAGTGTITIGDTSGSANATLKFMGGTVTVANPITVASGSSGNTLRILHENGAPTFSGNVSLNNSLTVSTNSSASYPLTLSGNITGTGNLTFYASNIDTGVINLSGASINNLGTITNADTSTGTGTTTISGVIGSNVTGVIQNSATSELKLSGNNSSYAGGVLIKAGTFRLSTSANAAGTGTITIGDTSGSADATLLVALTNVNFANPITVASGSSGTLSIDHLGAAAWNSTVSGLITLNNNLTLTGLTGSDEWNLTGGITGTGNVRINNTGSSGATTTISTASINNAGTITNSGTGTGATIISGTIGSNVTGVIQNSSTSKLVLSGNNSSVGNVTITSGTLELSGTTNLNVSGNWSNAGTFTANTSTVTFNSATQSLNCGAGGTTFNNLTFTAPQTITFAHGNTCSITGAFSATGSNGNLITLQSDLEGSASMLSTTATVFSGDYLSIKDINPVESETWYAGTHSTEVSNTGNWVFTGPPIIWVGGSGLNCSTNANWLNGAKPTVTDGVLFGSTSNAVVWDAGCPSTVASLSLGANFSGSLTLTKDLALTGNLSINAGTFSTGESGYALSVGGNFVNNGTFSANSGTVTLNGSSQTVNCGTGGTTFNNLTFTAPQTVIFANGKTCTIGGTFTANGSLGNLVTMQSDLVGNAFTLSKSSGTVLVSYCSIKDSTATGGAEWMAPTRQTNYDVSGNSGWVFNSPPEFDGDFGTNGVIVEQISDSQDAHFGYVKIQYKPFDSDTTGGSEANAGYITPSFQYKNGGSWINITSQYLDFGDLDRKAVGETAEGATVYTAYWNAGSQIPEIFSTSVQIKVGADDGETSNHLGSAESETFSVDTKVPVISVKTLDADAETLTVASSDDNDIFYRVSATSLAEDGSGSPSFTSVEAKTISDSFSVDVDSVVPTAYLQIKDTFGNLISETIVAPVGLTNFILKDTTNLQSGDYRQFLSWGVYANSDGATFASYKVYRASGDPLSDYSEIGTVSLRTTNYYTDTTVQAGTAYSYKVKVVDTDDDSSAFTIAVGDDSPDGQGGNDVVPPAISNVRVAKIQASWVKITWTTDEPANSIVYYSIHNEVPVYDLSKTEDSYSTSHEVILTGLTPETAYDYKVVSSDISENSSTDDNNGTGYSFTTIAGTVISDALVEVVTDTTATITWNTTTSSDSHVVYSTDASALATNFSSEPVIFGEDSSFSASLLSAGKKVFSKFFNWIWSFFYKIPKAHAEESGEGDETVETAEVLTSGSDTRIETAQINGLYHHKVVLTGLLQRTSYYFYVKSVDAEGNNATDNSGGNYYSFTTTYDITPPVISDITKPIITPSTVIVLWTTDELSDTQVYYGTESGSYPASTALDATLNISHVANISGLSANTKYYFVARSSDANGNVASSEEQDVTTTPSGQVIVNNETIGTTATVSGGGGGGSAVNPDRTPPIISDLTAESDHPFGATVTFKTDEATTAYVSYGESTNYGNTIADLGLSRSHTLRLNNLKMGTTYHLKAIAMDASGNIGQSDDVILKTKFVSEALDDLINFQDILQFQNKIEELIQSVLPSLVPPMIGNIKITDVAENEATIIWQTNVPAYEIIEYVNSEKYSTDNDNPYDQQANQTENKLKEHSIKLSGLLPSTSYHFRVKAYVLPGVTSASQDMTFATKANASGTETGKVGNTEFQVKWLTSQKTTSIVEYKNSTTGKIQQIEDSQLMQNHVIDVTDLTPNTIYSVRVYGYDADKNIIEGGGLTVKTTRDVVPPKISNIKINSALLPGQSNLLQTVISWTTDEPATSQVYYDEGVSSSDKLGRAVEQSGYSEQHILIVPSLKPSTVYRFKIVSMDEAKNASMSPIKTVLTPEKTENIIDIIMKNLQDSFGFLKKLQ